VRIRTPSEGSLGVAPVQFIVLRRKGKWIIKSLDLERAFADRSKALRAAVDLAQQSGTDGKPALVRVQLVDDQFEVIWEYGNPYPPKERKT
jgi:hypothetical protein